ncbi:class I SAM-dependent methyltransferase [Pseudanabaena sp. UWO311]|uniref:methyltransferase domain-containing protein n=1 Tax=Pseudanabaena sp. UWO311 TaxID=2487337 RepID=UPI001156D18B|nr:class I SAM-dependent methyltransferase [Pseudanabaena sp. UWO311]TYQ26996.1 class I SAM-dependent methyltransferase [Pseudanabaena sp. UWO311]
MNYLNKFLQRVTRKIKSVKEEPSNSIESVVNLASSPIGQDEFEWNSYNSHYRSELDEIQKVHTLRISSEDYSFINNFLVSSKGILPLHPNHRLLYETILQLSPRSVIEIGCGGGDHLHNMSILSSTIDLYGCDLSEAQIDYLRERNPNLRASIQRFDITLPFSSLLPLVDISYTQAVIMHLKTVNNHLIALSNLFKLAKNQVILMENWSNHNFKSDIEFLFNNGMLPWTNLYFYFRRAPELNNHPHIMIVSCSKLDYEELLDYKLLLQNL